MTMVIRLPIPTNGTRTMSYNLRLPATPLALMIPVTERPGDAWLHLTMVRQTGLQRRTRSPSTQVQLQLAEGAVAAVEPAVLRVWYNTRPIAVYSSLTLL